MPYTLISTPPACSFIENHHTFTFHTSDPQSETILAVRWQYMTLEQNFNDPTVLHTTPWLYFNPDPSGNVNADCRLLAQNANLPNPSPRPATEYFGFANMLPFHQHYGYRAVWVRPAWRWRDQTGNWSRIHYEQESLDDNLIENLYKKDDDGNYILRYPSNPDDNPPLTLDQLRLQGLNLQLQTTLSHLLLCGSAAPGATSPANLPYGGVPVAFDWRINISRQALTMREGLVVIGQDHAIERDIYTDQFDLLHIFYLCTRTFQNNNILITITPDDTFQPTYTAEVYPFITYQRNNMRPFDTAPDISCGASIPCSPQAWGYPSTLSGYTLTVSSSNRRRVIFRRHYRIRPALKNSHQFLMENTYGVLQSLYCQDLKTEAFRESDQSLRADILTNLRSSHRAHYTSTTPLLTPDEARDALLMLQGRAQFLRLPDRSFDPSTNLPNNAALGENADTGPLQFPATFLDYAPISIEPATIEVHNTANDMQRVSFSWHFTDPLNRPGRLPFHTAHTYDDFSDNWDDLFNDQRPQAEFQNDINPNTAPQEEDPYVPEIPPEMPEY